MPGRRNQGRGGQGGRGGRSAQQTGRGSQGKKAKQKRQYHPHNLEFTHGQVTVYLLEAIALKSLDYTQDKMSLLIITEDGSKPKLIKCSRSLGFASEKKVS
ncbi:unnamed protein product [Cylindrotheca closterium]|uniref:Uncharacterized protein n=1 Tax=Cylindrotheca closterium TaxID=2856 RepID=A0AAD2CWX6_9STRA|nr:unnamed protein product [Cylindrotheca closterium]